MLTTPTVHASTVANPNTHTTAQGAATTTWEHEGLAAIITDLVGTPIRLLDTNGTTTWTSQAGTWGATHADTAMPLRFPGQYHDTETGLVYDLHRYYNPDTGRYITTDPLGLAPSPNPNTYVPNPTTAIDPLGLNDHSVNQNAAGVGNRVFWSGGQADKEAAADFAAANGAKTFEMTAVGRVLERLPYNRMPAKLWDAAPAVFAATARGEVNVFIGPNFRGQVLCGPV